MAAFITCYGFSNAEIGDALGVGSRTVSQYIIDFGKVNGNTFISITYTITIVSLRFVCLSNIVHEPSYVGRFSVPQFEPLFGLLS